MKHFSDAPLEDTLKEPSMSAIDISVLCKEVNNKIKLI